MHQSLTIHALRPSFAMTGSAFAMIVSASPSKKVATGAAESSVSLGKTSIKPVRKAVISATPLGCTERLTFPKVFIFVRKLDEDSEARSEDSPLEEPMSSKNFGVFISQGYSYQPVHWIVPPCAI